MTNNGAAAGRHPTPLARDAARAFEAAFGRPAEWIVTAPGRVNLMGDHTDYNGGFALPMAIERSVVVVAARAGADEGRRLRVHSVATAPDADVPLDGPARAGQPPWSNYVRGVLGGFHRRGASVPPMVVWVASNLPLGAGLSSSAALEVAAATLFEAASGTLLAPVEKAKLCQRAEHEFVGVPCGPADQLAATLAEESGPLLVDCRSEIARSVRWAGGGASVLICDTGVRRPAGAGPQARRYAECESAARCLGVGGLRDCTLADVDAGRNALGPLLYRRARHVVTENARALNAARALEAGDFAAAGHLFDESHRSLQDDYEVSCPELDFLVETARSIGVQGGVYGSRMTGTGFGGCTVTLVHPARADDVGRELAQRYESHTGGRLDAFVSAPARGAHRIAARDLA